ncbi:MAG: hypothetical protein CVV44_22485 [Spirochaetae bacterium HGW-Spirochaetae-1]|nr:MAG: hypothetical protein CVV44_22485 [Spirochaetae bacterium HGW-Spirochaetae-1]
MRRIIQSIVFMFTILITTVTGIQAQDTENTDIQPGIDNTAKETTARETGILGNFSLDGYFWVDPSYRFAYDGLSDKDYRDTSLQGRLVLGVNYRKELKDYYVLARAEIISHVDEPKDIDTLDSYLQCGNKYWDVQIGRFLAYELYHKGQGLELYTDEDAGAIDAPDLYEVDYVRGHADDAGQVAFHIFPLKGIDMMDLKIEVAGIYGQESASQNDFGIRPVVDYSYWRFQVVAGMEYLLKKSRDTASKTKSEVTGYGGRLQYNTDFITAGVNFARASRDSYTTTGVMDTAGTYTITSFGGFADIDFWRNSIGLGCHYTTYKAENLDDKTHLQPFVSYLYRLPFEGLTVKGVFSWALADIDGLGVSNAYTNDIYSMRIRIRYDFL